MPLLFYRALSRDGEIVTGREEVVSEIGLERLLSERGLYPLDVKHSYDAERRSRRRARWSSREADLTESVTTLAVLLAAGLTLDSALEVTSRGSARADLMGAWEAVRQRVNQGERIAEAMEEWPRLFPVLVRGMVRAGEQGGHLSIAIGRLAQHLERQAAVRAKLLSAMLYPLLLLVVGAAALLVLVLAVLPRFVTLLGDAGAQLPYATSLLLKIVSVTEAYWLVGVAAGAASLVGLSLWTRERNGRERIDSFLLGLPLLGDLRTSGATARLARTLSTLLASGMSLVPALGVAASAVGDSAIRRQVITLQQAVRRGDALSAALQRAPAFPYSFVRMVEVGERSGQMESLLERAADLLETDLSRRLDRLVGLLEPILILLFGLCIGFVALSLLQAIYGIHADTF